MAKAKPKAKSKAKSKAKKAAQPKKSTGNSKAKTKPKTSTKPAVKATSKVKPKTKVKSQPKAIVKVHSKPKITAQKFTFRPLDDRILVRVKAGEKKTPGGLYIPDTASIQGHSEAEVLAVGPGHRTKKGNVRPLDVKVGDLVVFAQYTGTELPELEEGLRLLRESEILGLVD